MSKLDVEAVELLLVRVAAMRAIELLGRDAFGFGLQHDRRAVRVVGADEMHLVALHPLEAHPDVGLDVLHDVPDVERPVRVGKAVVTNSVVARIMRRGALVMRRDWSQTSYANGSIVEYSMRAFALG